MKTRVTELLNIEYPVIQGGMAWVADANLAAHVSKAGGMGFIGAANAPAEWVKEQIHIARKITDKPVGVNIMLLSDYADEIAQLVIDEHIEAVTTGAGNPSKYMKAWKEAGIRVIPVVASVALARMMERAGADAVVAEGMESGGHIGEETTMTLVPQVVDAVNIPVIAAGGIGDGRGVCAAFMLAVAVVFDYMAFYRRHKALKHSLLCDEIFQVELYDTSDAIEDDYQQLLTKVLTQKYQANELREKSMADLRDYYAIWAHQIKTPISAIDVLLQAENEPDKIDLKELKRQLFNIDFYVDAVMNYLRLEDMSSDYVFEDCQVEKIVRKAVKKFAAQFMGKKISIELNNLDTNVKTDEKWLGFIIEQLISNAVKYTRNGGKISIYMKETFNSADRILVIEDNGIGITKEDIPRIFERGYTGYNGRMSKKSSGIGLYLCRKAERRMLCIQRL